MWCASQLKRNCRWMSLAIREFSRCTEGLELVDPPLVDDNIT